MSDRCGPEDDRALDLAVRTNPHVIVEPDAAPKLHLFSAETGALIRTLDPPADMLDTRDWSPDGQAIDYVVTTEDKGGVHINSGILNHGFYIATMSLGGKTWEVLGRIWYAVLTERLTADADFDAFARATIDVAGELYGIGGEVQQIVADAWEKVGLEAGRELSPAA